MIYGNKLFPNTDNQEVVQEISINDFFDMIKKWKTSNNNHQWLKFSSDSISDKDYEKLEKIFEDLKDSRNYSRYSNGFKQLCRYINIGYDGTIITKHKLTKGKPDHNKLFVEYNFNKKKFRLPDGLGLFHISKVPGIKALKPTFRGKSEKGYLYYKPRIYFTINKYMPTLAADYANPTTKLYKYRSKVDIKDVYVDPLLPNQIFGAIYVETDKPIPVENVSDNIVKDTEKMIKKTIDDTVNQNKDNKENN